MYFSRALHDDACYEGAWDSGDEGRHQTDAGACGAGLLRHLEEERDVEQDSEPGRHEAETANVQQGEGAVEEESPRGDRVESVFSLDEEEER